jgi:hypothetical protein
MTEESQTGTEPRGPETRWNSHHWCGVSAGE